MVKQASSEVQKDRRIHTKRRRLNESQEKRRQGTENVKRKKIGKTKANGRGNEETKRKASTVEK